MLCREIADPGSGPDIIAGPENAATTLQGPCFWQQFCKNARIGRNGPVPAGLRNRNIAPVGREGLRMRGLIARCGGCGGQNQGAKR